MAQERTQNNKQNQTEGKTDVTDPGRTPGQAEGERTPSVGDTPMEPGYTAGQAEGERGDGDYDYQRREVREGMNGGSKKGKASQTVQKQMNKARSGLESGIESGVERFSQSWQEGGTAGQMREQVQQQFQRMAGEQAFSPEEIKRWVAMIGGGFLAFHWLRRSLGSLTLAGVGMAFFYWGFSGESPLKLLQRSGATTHEDAASRIRSGSTERSFDISASPKLVTKSIIVKAKVSDAFSIWSNFENFPHFMQHIKSIRKTGDDLSHWTMEGPLGRTIEWDAKTTRFEENKRIGWSSIGGDIKTSGQVTFNSLPDGETEVTVTLQYIPPAGMAGEIVAQLLDNPEAKLDEDLRNFKRYIEKK